MDSKGIRKFVMGWRLIVLLATVVVLLAAVGFFLLFPQANAVAGYLEGRAAAEQELADGRAVDLFSGLPNWGEMLDRKTGLPHATTGCIVDPRIRGYVKGYRKVVEDYIRRHGPPANSRLKWDAILFNLKDSFALQSLGAPPAVLKVDGSLTSPNGGTIVTLRIKPPTAESPTAYLEGTIRTAGREEIAWHAWPLRPDNTSLQSIWGPEGSDFILLQGVVQQEPPVHFHGALDLRTGRWLRYEVDP